MLLESLESVLQPEGLKVGGATLRLGTGCRLLEQSRVGDLDVLAIAAAEDVVRVTLEVPLGEAEGYWYPNARANRSLPPDWRGTDKTSIISSSPIGCLYDRKGQNLLAFCFDQQVRESTLRFGVTEERKSFVVAFEHQPRAGEAVRLALAPIEAGYQAALSALRNWVQQGIGAALPVPPTGIVPLYSTWYTYSQAIDATKIEREAGLSRELGCGAVIIDDGWQKYGNGRKYAGCGDWVPDPAKFPDMAGHVARLHELGLSVLVWLAPLLVGRQSDAAAVMAAYGPHYSDHLRAHVLDPRRPETRAHVVRTCLRLVRDYRLDGLKIDFLDTVVAYQGSTTTGDIADVGEAVEALLAQLRDGLDAAGCHNVLIEFRQSYIGPATAPYGNLLRAGDCPADAVVNRRSIIDTRLLATGQVVHADPVMWDPLAGAESAARQLMNAYFGVPQLSMELSSLAEPQRKTTRALLQLWMETRQTVLFGALTAGLPSENYPLILARDADRLVAAFYQPVIWNADPAGAEEIVVLNATTANEVLLRWEGPVGELRGEAFSAQGDSIGEVVLPLSRGVVSVGVPQCGFGRFRLHLPQSPAR